MSKIIRISDSSAKNLDELSKMTHKPKQKIIEKALEVYAREQFLKKSAEAYRLLKENPKLYQEFKEELQEWDVTLSDGLDDE